MSCIFCKIINKEIPSNIIYEDDCCLAILDISQASRGHILVIPKRHYDNMLDCDDDIHMHLLKIAKMLAGKQVSNLKALGVNILINTNSIAGQSVMHYHVHVIPRYDEHEITFSLSDNSNKFDLNEIQKQLN